MGPQGEERAKVVWPLLVIHPAKELTGRALERNGKQIVKSVCMCMCVCVRV